MAIINLLFFMGNQNLHDYFSQLNYFLIVQVYYLKEKLYFNQTLILINILIFDLFLIFNNLIDRLKLVGITVTFYICLSYYNPQKKCHFLFYEKIATSIMKLVCLFNFDMIMEAYFMNAYSMQNMVMFIILKHYNLNILLFIYPISGVFIMRVIKVKQVVIIHYNHKPNVNNLIILVYVLHHAV